MPAPLVELLLDVVVLVVVLLAVVLLAVVLLAVELLVLVAVEVELVAPPDVAVPLTYAPTGLESHCPVIEYGLCMPVPEKSSVLPLLPESVYEMDDVPGPWRAIQYCVPAETCTAGLSETVAQLPEVLELTVPVASRLPGWPPLSAYRPTLTPLVESRYTLAVFALPDVVAVKPKASLSPPELESTLDSIVWLPKSIVEDAVEVLLDDVAVDVCVLEDVLDAVDVCVDVCVVVDVLDAVLELVLEVLDVAGAVTTTGVRTVADPPSVSVTVRRRYAVPAVAKVYDSVLPVPIDVPEPGAALAELSSSHEYVHGVFAHVEPPAFRLTA